MLGLAKRTGARIFQASTSEVYGDPSVHPQPESYWGHVNPLGIRACYDEGKRAAETLFLDYHRQHRVRIKIARIFNTYGPRMQPNDGRVVSNFIVQALAGDQITLFGEGSQTRSFCHVSACWMVSTASCKSRTNSPAPLIWAILTSVAFENLRRWCWKLRVQNRRWSSCRFRRMIPVNGSPT